MAEPDLIVRRLVERRFEFVLIGGLAAVVHGVSLSTRDADICCAFDPENLDRLYAVVADLHPVRRQTPQKLPFELTPLLRSTLKNVYLSTDFGTLDCLSSVLGLGDYEAVRRQSIPLRLWGGECRILTIDALILAKQATSRPHDLQTITQLRIIQARQRES